MVSGQRGSKQMAQFSSGGEEEEQEEEMDAPAAAEELEEEEDEDEELLDPLSSCVRSLRFFLFLSPFVYW